jgi:hypothetical protein
MKPADNHTTHPAHELVWEQLPWYHNDGLDAARRAQVDSHLRECLICTHELRRLRQLSMAVVAPANEHACAQAFMRLSAEIDAQQGSWRGRLRTLLAGLLTPAPLMAGLAVGGLCALLVLKQHYADEAVTSVAEKQFQTLGRQERLPSQLDHPLLRVVLRDALDSTQRQDWLQRHAAELVDGPTPIGVMTVRVALGGRRIDAVIAQMRAEADTLFVEPLRTTGTRPDRRR